MRVPTLYKTLTDITQGADEVTAETNTSQQEHENTSWSQGGPFYTVDPGSAVDPTMLDTVDNNSLGDYLSRDVLLFEGFWNHNTDTQQRFDVWNQWLDNKYIYNKLSTYAFVRGDLILTIRVNGSPFQYGKLMFSYVPYYYDNGAGSFSVDQRNQMAGMAWDTLNAATATHGKREVAFRHFSTYPTGLIDPSSSESVEVKCPFVWHNNFLLTHTSASDETPGYLFMFDLSKLRLANDNAPDKVAYNIYARMENVVLSTPTRLDPSSEHAVDVSNIPPTTEQSSKVPPIIAKLAKATKIGATAAEGVATLFGFSKPPDVDSPVRCYLDEHDQMATTVGKRKVNILSLDPKQEVTIDPSVVGIDGNDEMTFQSIQSRKQLVARPTWSGDEGQDGTYLIYAGLVSPNNPSLTWNIPINHNSKDWHPSVDTPAGMIANMFGYWRGSVTYSIEVVATAMHSGRLLVQFDPHREDVLNVADLAATNDVTDRHSFIMDLKESRTAEFTINYTSQKPWLQTSQEIENFQWPMSDNDGTTQLTNMVGRYNTKKHMGIISIRVLNTLVGPIATNTTDTLVDVLIYQKWEDDLQFGEPYGVIDKDQYGNNNWPRYLYVPRGPCCCKRDNKSVDNPPRYIALEDPLDGYEYNFLLPSSEEPVQKTSTATPITDDGDAIFFGERVVSLRSIGKRLSANAYWGGNTSQTGASYSRENYVLHFPEIAHTLSSEAGKGNNTWINCYESYFSPWFIAKRGSMVKRLYYMCNDPVSSTPIIKQTLIERQSKRTAGFDVHPYNWSKVNTLNDAGSSHALERLPLGLGGMGQCVSAYKPGHDFIMPWYSNTRFALAAHPYMVNDGASNTARMSPTMDQILATNLTLFAQDPSVADPVILEYSAIGDDYSCMFFVGIPLVWNES